MDCNEYDILARSLTKPYSAPLSSCLQKALAAGSYNLTATAANMMKWHDVYLAGHNNIRHVQAMLLTTRSMQWASTWQHGHMSSAHLVDTSCTPHSTMHCCFSDAGSMVSGTPRNAMRQSKLIRVLQKTKVANITLRACDVSASAQRRRGCRRQCDTIADMLSTWEVTYHSVCHQQS